MFEGNPDFFFGKVLALFSWFYRKNVEEIPMQPNGPDKM